MEEQCAKPGNVLYTIIVFTRHDPAGSGNMEGRRRQARAGGGDARKKRRRRDAESERKKVDNSQDRIVPGAKKDRSIPECYRMAREPSASLS